MSRIDASECNVSSLDGMHTDFDGWTRKFTQVYRERLKHCSIEVKPTIDKTDCIDNRHFLFDTNDIYLKEWKKQQSETYSTDYLYYSILLRFVNYGRRPYMCKLCLFLFFSITLPQFGEL